MKHAAVVLGLALVLLASGCSDDGGASPTLPPITASLTVSASATPSPTASATLSAAPFPNTPQGAAAFARVVYAEIDRAYASRNEEILRAIFEPGCTACNNYIGTIERMKEDSLTFTGGTSVVLSAETPGGQTGLVTVSTRSDYKGIIFRDPAGKVVASEPAGEVQDQMTLRRVGDSWTVAQISSRR